MSGISAISRCEGAFEVLVDVRVWREGQIVPYKERAVMAGLGQIRQGCEGWGFVIYILEIDYVQESGREAPL